ncbi:MAG: hypothetical protein K2J74_08700, partial [Muribaculaceae bacterium]|nr:hypothetical protein [Muribaculaceae bacterium]
MSDNTIKISKAAKDLNVGFSKLIDFLRQKDIAVESSPNARISQEQYEMLAQAFKSDKDDKAKSTIFTNTRTKTAKKPERTDAQEIHTVVTPTPGPKIVGKIDLSGKKKAAQPAVEKAAQPAPQPKKVENKPETPAQKPVEAATPAPKKVEVKPTENTAKKEVKAEAKSGVTEAKPAAVSQQQKAKEEPKQVAKKEEKPAAQPPAAEPAAEKKEELFTLGVPKPNLNINVVGKIDLSSLNQTTRPKKKTKEERKNERIAKEKARHAAAAGANTGAKEGGQQGGAPTGNPDKKKRRRIGTEKVDIEKSGSQIKDFGNQKRGDKRGA